MKQILRMNSFILLFGSLMLITSCADSEPCDGNCPTGFVCENDKCVVDPNFNPCAGVVCGPDEQCVNGNCEDIIFGENVVTGEVSTNTTWTADKIHILATKVYVKEGVTLTIEPGTVIKGREGIGSLATALIISRGARIIAEGTAEKPIIFTSTLDNVRPGQKAGNSLTEYDFGKWGGLIVLGKAPISATNGDTETQIEGIPGDLTYGKYGGAEPADNSGVLKYVSIRHGGALIGDGNEINGLTLGGVGNGTVVENIEIVGNLDDGLEIFGGTVNVKNLAVGFIGDDALDVDQNYSGTVDNFYIIHGSDNTDEALELDGPEGSTYKDGLFTIKNGTVIAVDQILTSAADLKAKCQGTLENISFKGYKKGKHLAVRAAFNTASSCAEKTDAFTYLRDGRLVIKNCQVLDTEITAADATRVYTDSGASDAAAQKECLNNVSASYEELIDGLFGTNGNKVTGTATVGANKAAFNTWTYLSTKNKLQ
ncbi:MAG TPA: hypothetical protein PLQ57_04145 [Saprospiraceae bacterium]|nr:hypothetical protein [Saprospiraceae bacterium]HRG20191.1 hypothetical protein [Saprospiraceae bacterium]HRG65237.1 hypothetical protein [Saprospiraceae bacterium]